MVDRMMRIFFAVLFCLSAAATAVAQTFPGQLPAWNLYGNPSGSPSNPGAATVMQMLNGVWGTPSVGNVPLATGPSTAIWGDAAPNGVIYVATAGNDSNSGLSPFSPKLTIQAGVNASGGKVIIGAGTYTLNASIAMRPGVTVQCVPGAIITQGNGANLTSLVEFVTNTASGAALEFCDINGNRSNNTDNVNVIMVNVRTANDVTLRNNTLRNSNGFCASTFTGVRVRYTDNFVTNCFADGLAVITGTPFTPSHCDIRGNHLIAPMGAHAIVIANADYCTVIDNDVIGDMIGGPSALLRVSTSGSTVTWISGPQFNSIITAGNYLVINGGAEFQVTSITDSTHLQVSGAPGTLTNVLAVIGTGDLVSIDSSSYTIFANNHVATNVTQGVSLNTGTGGEIAQKNMIANNHVQFIGEMCVGVQQTGAVGFDGNTITGNILEDCGMSGSTATGGGGIQAAIELFGANILGTFIESNSIRDDQMAPTISYWLAFSGPTAGQVILGKNSYVGTVNSGILNDITAITLNSAWGTTANASAVVSQGDSVILTVNSSGSGQANPAAVSIGKISTVPSSGGPGNQALIICKEVNTDDTAFNFVAGEYASTSTVWNMIYQGLPVAGKFYRFICKG
jgi:hypothetical protein